MKNEGVTILQVVITVIIMLVILAVSVFLGPNVAREAKLTAIYNEIKEIESVFKEMQLLGKMKVNGEKLSFYEEIEVPKIENADYNKEIGENTEGDFYYLDFTSSRKLENVLGLERINNDYILDLENLNIYLVGGVDILDDNGMVVIKYNSDEISDYYSDTFVK